MIYKAKPERLLLCFSSLLTISASISARDMLALQLFLLISGIILLLLIPVNYFLHVNDNQLIYTVKLFNFTIYNKQLDHTSIKTIMFKRVRLLTRAAIVKPYRGLALRIILYTPETVYNDLVNFAIRNNITYTKTNDYLLIEKMV